MERKNRKIDVLIICLMFLSVIVYSPPRSVDIIQSDLFNIYNMPRVISAITCILLIFCYLVLNGLRVKNISLTLSFVLLYWVTSAVSLFSSGFDTYGLAKYMEYFVVVLGVLYFSTRYSYDRDLPERLLSYVRKVYLFFLGTIFLGIVVSPSTALTQQSEYSELREATIPFILRGYLLTFSQTQVGYMSSFIFFYYFTKYFEKGLRKKEILISICSLVSLILAQTRMSWIGLAISILIYLLFINKNKINAFFAIFMGLISMSLLSEFILKFIFRGQSLESVTSISGRTKWWSDSITAFKNGSILEKVFGYGFGSGEQSIAFSSSVNMSTLDSDFFGSLASTGLVGLTFIISISVLTVYKIFRSIKLLKKKNISSELRLMIIFSLGVMIMFSVKMFTVTTLSLSNPDFILFVICSFSNHLLQKKIKTYEINKDISMTKKQSSDKLKCNSKDEGFIDTLSLKNLNQYN